MDKILVVYVAICFLFVLSGCATAANTGDEQLVQSRISAAVRAERDRWTTELSRQLQAGLEQIDDKVGRVSGAVEQLRTAVVEYRQLFLSVIDSLQSAEDGVSTSVEGAVGLHSVDGD